MFTKKCNAVTSLKKKFLQDVDYQVFLKNGENPLGGRPEEEYRLSVKCFGFLIARENDGIF